MLVTPRTPPQALCFAIPGSICLRLRTCATLTRTDDVTIRPARTSDALALATLVSEAFRPTRAESNRIHATLLALARYVERGDLAAQFAARTPSRRSRRHALLLAEEGKAVIGCVEVGVLPAPASVAEGDVARVWASPIPAQSAVRGTPYIGNLAVSSARRRRGLGDRLVEAAETEARAWGADNVALHVDARNTAAQALYRRRGYDCRVREPIWYPAVGRLQRLFLAKDFETDKGVVSALDWTNAPIVHTRPLTPWEYLRWCIYDLRKQDGK